MQSRSIASFARLRTRLLLVGLAVVAGVGLNACRAIPMVLSGHVTVAGTDGSGYEVAVYRADTPTLVARTSTGAGGAYAFPEEALADGTYRVRVASTAWFTGTSTAATDWADAADVDVSGDRPAVVDMAVASVPDAAASGTVAHRDGSAAAGFQVQAVNAATGRIIATDDSLGTDGSWSIDTLPPGGYRFHAVAVDPGSRLTNRWNGSVALASQAPVIELSPAGSVGDIDITLDAEAGLVAPMVDPVGVGIPGLTAVAVDADNRGGAAVDTDANGIATVHNLDTGRHRLLVVDPSHRFRMTWVGGNTGDPDPGFTVTAGATTVLEPTTLLGWDCDGTTHTAGADLTGADLADLHLQGCDLTGANLTGADLTRTDLTGATLTGADLTGADLTGADVTGADLAGVTLTGVASGELVGAPAALPADWQVANGYLIGPGADLAGADLMFVELPDGSNLAGANLTGANLRGFRLRYGNLSGADLTGADMTYVDIRYTSMVDTVITGATVTGSLFHFNDFTGLVSGGVIGHSDYVVIDNASVVWRFVGGWLVNADTDFATIDFTGADLTGADFTGYDLTGIDLTGRDLTGANFTGTNLTTARLAATTLTGVGSGGITGAPASLPDRWHLVNGHLVGPGANLTAAQLGGRDLSGMDLTGANLTDATLTGANLAGTDLTGTNLTGVVSGQIVGTPVALPDGWALVLGRLVGSGADLSGEDLSGANLANMDLSGDDLTGTNLTGANLSGANLTGATLTGATIASTDFTGATLDDVRSGALTGTPAALPPDWHVVAGHLVGPGADLTGADLSGANLSGLDLTGANLTGADVTGADLTGVTLTGATLAGFRAIDVVGVPAAMPDGWQLVDTWVLGPGADLSRADLRALDVQGVFLGGVNLSGANLSGMDLSGVDLSRDIGVTLVGANLSGADLTGASLRFQIAESGLNLDGATLVDADLVGLKLWYGSAVGADVSGADLTYANLRYGDYSSAVFTGADISRSYLLFNTMTGVVSGGMTGAPDDIAATDGTSLTVRGGFFIGSGLDHTGADLSGFDLAGIDLHDSDFTGADLSGATLTGANIDGANFAGADVTGTVTGGMTGTPAVLPPGYALVDGSFVAN